MNPAVLHVRWLKQRPSERAGYGQHQDAIAGAKCADVFAPLLGGSLRFEARLRFRFGLVDERFGTGLAQATIGENEAAVVVPADAVNAGDTALNRLHLNIE